MGVLLELLLALFLHAYMIPQAKLSPQNTPTAKQVNPNAEMNVRMGDGAAMIGDDKQYH